MLYIEGLAFSPNGKELSEDLDDLEHQNSEGIS
jgi:hypothetical protein